MNDHTNTCLFCGLPTGATAACRRCRFGIERTWCVGERNGGLELLINRYKFEYAEAAYKSLGDLLLECLPELPAETIVVPVPTVRTHIRQRGYDHTLLLARYIAKKRGLTLAATLERRSSAAQRGANRKVRRAQAQAAFHVTATLQTDTPYLMIDDVVTTGATLQYGAKALKEAGATIVWAAAVARQPLKEVE